MKTMKGPGLFLAQFLRDEPPYDRLENIAGWVADLGYKGVQIPTWDPRVIDLDKAARSKGYCEFIRLYGDRIKSFHVKDAEFQPSGRVGVYGGYESWAKRAGRFRSLGDGQVDFKRIFTLLTEAGYQGWAVLEWECCVKSPEQGALEGALFIAQHIIEATALAFDDFAGGKTDVTTNRKILGLV
jgi:sugar phosphate isomerase/epimerase